MPSCTPLTADQARLALQVSYSGLVGLHLVWFQSDSANVAVVPGPARSASHQCMCPLLTVAVAVGFVPQHVCPAPVFSVSDVHAPTRRRPRWLWRSPASLLWWTHSGRTGAQTARELNRPGGSCACMRILAGQAPAAAPRAGLLPVPC